MTTHSQAESLAKQYAENFPKMFGTDYTDAVSFILPNLPNGCSWGMIHQDKLTRDSMKSLNSWSQSGEIQVYRLKNGVLLNTDFNTLVSRIQSAVPIFNQQTLIEAGVARDKAIENFEKYLKQMAKKGSPGDRIGLFCVNDDPRVTESGKSYRAYNVDIVTAAQIAQGYGYVIDLNGHRVDAATVANQFPQVMKVLEMQARGNAIMVNFVKF